MSNARFTRATTAAASGRTVLAPPVDVAAVVARVKRALDKVYAAKALKFETEVAPDARFRGDEDDLMEIVGNLLDNACKWADSAVRVRARPEAGVGGTSPGFVLDVVDDGPGVREDRVEAILQRGVREDTTVPGQGIGLAVVHDLATSVYGGAVRIERADLGGARVRVRLPQPAA